jgi:flagellar biosynthetic protein FliR
MEFIPFLVKNEIEFLLVLIRVASLVTVIPMIGGEGVPVRVKVMMAFGISLVLFPLVQTEAREFDPTALGAGILGEVLIGVIIGLSARMIFAAVDIASETEGLQMGFGIASIFNPTFGQQVSLLGQLRGLVAVLIFFAINAHHIILQALVRSFQIVPSLSFSPSGPLIDHIMRLAGGMFVLGVKIAIPVTLVLILANMAFGILSRVVPQINVLLFGFPATIALGLFVIGASLSLFAGLIQGQMEGLSGVTLDLLNGMRGP